MYKYFEGSWSLVEKNGLALFSPAPPSYMKHRSSGAERTDTICLFFPCLPQIPTFPLSERIHVFLGQEIEREEENRGRPRGWAGKYQQVIIYIRTKTNKA